MGELTTRANRINNNADYVVKTTVANGSFLYLTELLGDPETVSANTFNGQWCGVCWVNFGTITDNPYFHIIQHLGGMTYSTDDGVSLNVSLTAGVATLRLSRIVWVAGGLSSPSLSVSTTFPVNNKWFKIAWFLDTTAANHMDTFIYINDVNQTIAGSFQEGAVSHLVTNSVVMSPQTPAGFKLGTLWSTFSIPTAAAWLDILSRRTIKAPLYYGKNGRGMNTYYPAVYINPAYPVITNSKIPQAYTLTGTVDYTQELTATIIAQ